MSLEIITARVAVSESGAPVHLVRCTKCGVSFRRVGYPGDIAKRRGCASCSRKARRP